MPVLFVNQVGGNDELVFDGRSAVFGADGAVLARACAFGEEILVCDLASGGPRAPDLASDEEAAYEALVLGVRDYARKCGFRRAILGLSGGIDSALTATLAADALGAENVLRPRDASRYSSDGSRSDAEALARKSRHRLSRGVHRAHVPRVPLGTRAAGRRPGQPASGDVTFENLQARIRGAMLMAISNHTSALLLTTGNKSEVGVRFCTLYGDMAGGLAVVRDVPRPWSTGSPTTPTESASAFLAPPSRRLRARARPGQVDQSSLPPYEVLDRILERYVEDGLGRDAMVAEGFDAAVVDPGARARSHERVQAATGSPRDRLDQRKAFGVGRRMPIDQGWKQ